MLEHKTHNVMVDTGALLPLIVSNALNALGAILILLIGLWLSGWADRLIVTMLRGERRMSIRCCRASSAASPATWS